MEMTKGLPAIIDSEKAVRKPLSVAADVQMAPSSKGQKKKRKKWCEKGRHIGNCGRFFLQFTGVNCYVH